MWFYDFPTDAQLPLGQEAVVWASPPGGPRFEQKVTLTTEAPVQTIVVAFDKGRPLGLFGFQKADLLKSVGYHATNIRKVRPRALLFEISAGHPGRGGVEFAIDDQGVVLGVTTSPQGSTDYVALGYVDQTTLSSMAAAGIRAHANGLRHERRGCYDCGFSTIRVREPKDNERASLELATDGETRRRVASAEGERVLIWLLSVREKTGRRYWGH